MKTSLNSLPETVREAVDAAQSKKARDVVLLDVAEAAGFTDHFLICSGASNRQVQAIADEVDRRLSRAGLRATHIEGYNHAEWVLMDYVDLVVHVFSEKAREFYDLERLWRTAPRHAFGAQEQAS